MEKFFSWFSILNSTVQIVQNLSSIIGSEIVHMCIFQQLTITNLIYNSSSNTSWQFHPTAPRLTRDNMISILFLDTTIKNILINDKFSSSAQYPKFLLLPLLNTEKVSQDKFRTSHWWSGSTIILFSQKSHNNKGAYIGHITRLGLGRTIQFSSTKLSNKTNSLSEVLELWKRLHSNFKSFIFFGLLLNTACPHAFPSCFVEQFLRKYNCTSKDDKTCLSVFYSRGARFRPTTQNAHNDFLFHEFSPYGVVTSGFRYTLYIDNHRHFNSNIASIFSPLDAATWLHIGISLICLFTILSCSSFRDAASWIYATALEQGDTGVDHWKNNQNNLIFILIIWMFVTLFLRNFYTFSMYSFITAEPKLTGLPCSFKELVFNSSFQLMTTRRTKSLLEIEFQRNYEIGIKRQQVSGKGKLSHDLFNKLRVFALSNDETNELLPRLSNKKPIYMQNASGSYNYEDNHQFGFVFQQQSSELRTLLSVFSGKRMVDTNRNDYIFPGIMAWDSFTKNELLFEFFKDFLKRFVEFGLYDYLRHNSSLIKNVALMKIANNNWFKRKWNFVALKQYYIDRNSDMFIGKPSVPSSQLHSLLVIWYILLVLHSFSVVLFVVELLRIFETNVSAMRIIRNYIFLS